MKSFNNIRVYAWVEFGIWLIVVAAIVLGFRYHHYQEQKLHTARSFDELSKSLDAFKNAIDAEKEYNERKKMLEKMPEIEYLK